jgi:hypothetical protein
VVSSRQRSKNQEFGNRRRCEKTIEKKEKPLKINRGI